MNAPRIRTRAGEVHAHLDPASLDAIYGPEHLASCRAAGGSRAGERGPSLVSGPFDYWYLRHLRERIGLPSPTDADVRGTDLFLWSAEPSTRRDATRLGGVPHLPRSRDWPRRHGVPGCFVGQLNFADSRDLVPFAPRELLLMFTFEHAGFDPWQRDDYAFVWVDADDAAAPYEPDDVPSDGLHHDHELHGVRVRSFDEPSLVARIRGEGLPHVHVIRGTKIGGAASDDQSIDPPDVPPDWRFLGQFVHQYPSNDVPFPVLGHPASVTWLTPAFDALTGGRHGVTGLFLDGRDEVQVSFSCS